MNHLPTFYSLHDIYPALEKLDEDGNVLVPGLSANQQATRQLLATIMTFFVAIIGGAITGLIMKGIGSWQHLDKAYHKGMTVMKLALTVGNLTAGAVDIKGQLPIEAYFDDNLFFEVNEDQEDEPDAQQEQTVIIKDDKGKTHQYRRYSITQMSYQSNNTISTIA